MNLPFFNWIENFLNFKFMEKAVYKDQLTLDRIDKMHPAIRKKLKADYIECNKNFEGKFTMLRFAQGYRTIAEQNAIYAQGRTKPGKIVTNAKGGESIHNYGLAFDIVLLYDKDKNGTYETASWELNKDWNDVVNFFKSKGYTWGGDWKQKDYPHFEYSYGLTWRDLIKKERDANGYVIL